MTSPSSTSRVSIYPEPRTVSCNGGAQPAVSTTAARTPARVLARGATAGIWSLLADAACTRISPFNPRLLPADATARSHRLGAYPARRAVLEPHAGMGHAVLTAGMLVSALLAVRFVRWE